VEDTRLRIGIDVDMVLADFVKGFKIVAQEVVGHELFGEPIDWHMSNWFASDRQFEEAWHQHCRIPNFYRMLVPVPDVYKISWRWFANKHLLYFLTNRPCTAGLPIEVQTADWLRNYLYLSHPTVIVSDDKGSLAKALKLDVFIDDKPENLLEVCSANPSTRLYLMDCLHNRSRDMSCMTRVNCLVDFVKEMENLQSIAKLQ
jgi:5'(3')-deoxyribonucleotidase